jgi:hypothetical protein
MFRLQRAMGSCPFRVNIQTGRQQPTGVTSIGYAGIRTSVSSGIGLAPLNTHPLHNEYNDSSSDEGQTCNVKHSSRALPPTWDSILVAMVLLPWWKLKFARAAARLAETYVQTTRFAQLLVNVAP